MLTASATALAASTPPAGSVQQAFGKAGCDTDGGASEAGPHTCRNVRGANGATTVAISPDGRFAYIDGYGGNKTTAPAALAVLKRDPKTGALSQLSGKSGCFSGDGSSTAGSNTCTKARDLGSGDATSVVISSDGRFLYVASQNTASSVPVGGVAIFQRNLKTGTLRQLSGTGGCVTAVAYRGCAIAREVDDTDSLQITPDQRADDLPRLADDRQLLAALRQVRLRDAGRLEREGRGHLRRGARDRGRLSGRDRPGRQRRLRRRRNRQRRRAVLRQ